MPKPIVLLAMAAFVLTACGTRLPDSAFVESQKSSNAVSNSSASAGDASTPGSATSGDTGATSVDTGGGAAASGGTTGDAAASTGGGGTTSGGTTNGGATSGSGTTGGGTSGGGGEANTASDVGVTPTSIKIGNITAIQGVFGPDAFGVSLRGLQVFVQSINDRGGINGRKLQLVSFDDRANGARTLHCAPTRVDQ